MMTADRVTLLTAQMEDAWQSFSHQLQGLSDPEFFWQPAPHCWTVHQNASGRWIIDYADPPPDPPPITTIAWRLVHTAACKIMYYEYAFGPGQQAWDDLEIPHTAADAIAWLEMGHDQLRRALLDLGDQELDELRPTNWGELWPTWQLFWAMIVHDLQHGAEIGCLRQCYRARFQA